MGILETIKKFSIISAVVVAMLAAAQVHAETYTVDRTEDGGICFFMLGGGTSCTLRAAINLANSNPGEDTIIIANGIYGIDETMLVDDDANGLRDFDITDDVIIQGDPSLSSGAIPLKKLPLPIISGGQHSRVFHVLNNANVTFERLSIQSGSSPTEPGAGIYSDGSGDIILRDVELIGNEADAGGGLAIGTGTLDMERCLVSDNSAADFGGGVAVGTGSSNIKLVNVTISNNTAPTGGGLVSLADDVDLWHVTFYHNRADLLAAHLVAGDGEVNLYNSLLAQVDGSGGVDANCDTSGGLGTITSGGGNIDVDGTCNLTETTDQSGVDSADLKLQALAFNGGDTRTHALGAGSLAIDAAIIVKLAEDQRGFPRPLGVSSDVGAFEKGLCGNGIVDEGEDCDDGNEENGDGCDDQCEGELINIDADKGEDAEENPAENEEVIVGDGTGEESESLATSGGCSLNATPHAANTLGLFVMALAALGVLFGRRALLRQ